MWRREGAESRQKAGLLVIKQLYGQWGGLGTAVFKHYNKGQVIFVNIIG